MQSGVADNSLRGFYIGWFNVENFPILTPVRKCSGPKKTEHNRAVLLRCMQCHEIDMILNAPKMQIFAVECTKTIA